MVNIKMHVFKHPNYYKELRKRNKSDQVISDEASTEATSVHPGPGLKVSSSKRQAASDKDQASSVKHQALKLSNQPG
jgi:hypothetical protein